MRPKVYIPQPIPEVAVNRLRKAADVQIFPLCGSSDQPGGTPEIGQGQELPFMPSREIIFPAEVIDAASRI